jgi:hypothetical protein
MDVLEALPAIFMIVTVMSAVYSLQVVLNPPNNSSNGWPPFSECILQKAVIVFVLCIDLHVNYSIRLSQIAMMEILCLAVWTMRGVSLTPLPCSSVG